MKLSPEERQARAERAAEKKRLKEERAAEKESKRLAKERERELKEYEKQQAFMRAPRERVVLTVWPEQIIGRFRGLTSLVRKQADKFARYWSKSRQCRVSVSTKPIDYRDEETGPMVTFKYDCGELEFLR